jgi:signal peptidase I
MRQHDAIAEAIATRCELACEVLRSFGSLRFTATGWSMLPAVWSGDTLLVERVMPRDFRVGDIALVGREGRICAHRVVSVPGDSRSPWWITQGDAISTPDRPVSENELLGRVTQLVRSGKSKTVDANLSGLQRLFIQFVRRSVLAARVFVYITSKLQTQREPVLLCQG